MKQILGNVIISAVTAVVIVGGYGYFSDHKTVTLQPATTLPSNYKFVGLNEGSAPPPAAVDFTLSAQSATPAVVHIKTKTNAKQVTNSLPRVQRNPFGEYFDDDMFSQLFGRRSNIIPEQKASGSGVIVSEDGFIVTNNHVVQDADEVTVTLNNRRTYKAKVVGTDPSYDLAVIKIDAKSLPYLLYGNSDEVKIGQWVLAIGYPLDLETTVTAGIVSAKARSLGLNRKKSGNASAVESYIQTDAAVNMGNSGGALVNTDGRLVGINSAIASPTGYYSGYSYAIPVNIAKKVVDDLIKFGTVQRGYLGILMANAADPTLSDAEKRRTGIPVDAYDGIYASDVDEQGSAYSAGVRKGDRIVRINEVEIYSAAELQEQLSRFKPGDKVPLIYERNGKQTTVSVTLKNKANNYDIVKTDILMDMLGASLITMEKKKAGEYGIPGGVIVKKINAGGALEEQTRMKDGFVILKVNDKDVKSTEDLSSAIAQQKSFTLGGFYPGYDGLYEYQISLGQD